MDFRHTYLPDAIPRNGESRITRSDVHSLMATCSVLGTDANDD